MLRLFLPAILLISALVPATAKRPDYSSADYANRFQPTPSSTQPSVQFFVSPTSGNDANSGTSSAPFASLSKAKAAVRQHIKKGHPKGGIEVILKKGIYTESLVLSKEDSGTQVAPIIWRGEDRKSTRLSGGLFLSSTDLKPVAQDESHRLSPASRSHILSLTLTPEQLSSTTTQRGGSAHLVMDGHILNLARWPNQGYHHIDQILSPGPTTRWLAPGEKPHAYSKELPTGGSFTFREPLSPLVEKEFETNGSMWIEGYLSNDWYFQREAVGAIKGKVVQLLRHTRYGIIDKIKSVPRRVRIVNVLAELDEPGEWYLDRSTRKLYLWPLSGFNPTSSTLGFTGGSARFSIKGASHLTLQNLIIENSGDKTCQIENSSHVVVRDCIFRNSQRLGLRIEGGEKCGIIGCDFHGLDSAFSMSGGNIRELKRCYHFAINNHIHHCRARGYGLIGLRGCGLYFAHNLIHDLNGAVAFNTTDLLMEYNEFYNIGYEMGDFNVAYTGAKWHTQGNVLRFNFVHHMMEPGGHPLAAFRNDDGGSGLTLFGNIMYRTGRAAAQFHGPNNHLENTIALGMPTFWWTLKKEISPEGIASEWKALARFGRDLPKGSKGDYLYNLEKVIPNKGWEKEPWKSEYPEVARFLKINPFAQTLCRVQKNYAWNISKPFMIHGGDGTVEGMESGKRGHFSDLPKEGYFELPHQIDLSVFRDPEALDFRFKDSFKPIPGWVPIPFGKIGLLDPRDDQSLKKKTYRKAVYERFRDDQVRSYKPAIVNARYPAYSWLREDPSP